MRSSSILAQALGLAALVSALPVSNNGMEKRQLLRPKVPDNDMPPRSKDKREASAQDEEEMSAWVLFPPTDKAKREANDDELPRWRRFPPHAKEKRWDGDGDDETPSWHRFPPQAKEKRWDGDDDDETPSWHRFPPQAKEKRDADLDELPRWRKFPPHAKEKRDADLDELPRWRKFPPHVKDKRWWGDDDDPERPWEGRPPIGKAKRDPQPHGTLPPAPAPVEKRGEDPRHPPPDPTPSCDPILPRAESDAATPPPCKPVLPRAEPERRSAEEDLAPFVSVGTKVKRWWDTLGAKSKRDAGEDRAPRTSVGG